MADPVIYRQGDKPLHEYLRVHAISQPNKAALNWYGAEVSYQELDRLSDLFAASLHELGVGKGDRIALFLQNSPQYYIAYFGIQKIGAIVCPCSPLFKRFELETQLADNGASVILAADGLYPVVQQVLQATDIKHIFLTSYSELLPEHPSVSVPEEASEPKIAAIPGTMDFMTSLKECKADIPRPDLSMSDISVMSYTSGSTGKPKGAMLPYSQTIFKTAIAAENYRLDSTETMLAVAPLYHIAGMAIGISLSIYVGATTVLQFRFDPLAVLEAIDRYKVTFWYSITPMNIAVMGHPDLARFNLSSLRLNIVTGFGIRLTESMADEWRALTGTGQIVEAAYGLTETHTWDTCMPLDAVKWGTHGKVSPGVGCRIVDVGTRVDMPYGELGEILLQGPGLFKGYWKNPAAYAQAFEGEWFCTGDMGTLDKDGYLTLCGRQKEMIKVSGYSVFPEEVESILARHPGIEQAVVVGAADARKGEVVKAVLVMRPESKASASAETIIAWCRENMSPYKVPRLVTFVDQMPVTPTGKVLRRLVKEA